MNNYAEPKLLKIVEEILNLDPAMRFVAIIDLKGNILEAIMKEKKTSLETQKQQEKFCKDSAKTRSMREYYDESLGKTRYVHIEREKRDANLSLPTKKYNICYNGTRIKYR